jgi:peptide/nickel transport system ATP-binding protein
VLVLHQGRVVERGETSQVLRHPRDQYTIRLPEAIPNPFGRPGNHVTR